MKTSNYLHLRSISLDCSSIFTVIGVSTLKCIINYLNMLMYKNEPHCQNKQID